MTGLDILGENLGTTLDMVIIIFTVASSLIFFAEDKRIGLISLFLLSAVEFLVFQYFGWSYFRVLMLLGTVFVLMVLSLWVSHNKAPAVV